MTPKLFRFIKGLLFSNSWIDIIVKTLSRLPIPYWVTCWIIGFIMLYWVYVLSIRDHLIQSISQGGLTLSDWWGISIVFSISFLIPYSLYVLWRLENIAHHTLYDLKLLKKEESISKSMEEKFYRTGGITRLFENFLSLGLILYGVGRLNRDNTFAIVIISVPLFIAISTKIIKISQSIYRLNSKSFSINIFDLHPLYQLSQLTQQIALFLFPYSIVWLILGYKVMSVIFPLIFTDFSAHLLSIVLLTIIFSGPLLFLAEICVFILPIFWIRKKIIETKANMLSNIGIALQELFNDQDNFAKEGGYTKVVELKEYANILISRKEYIQKIAEWPWESRIFSEFSAVVFFPFILWIAQFLLSRWLTP